MESKKLFIKVTLHNINEICHKSDKIETLQSGKNMIIKFETKLKAMIHCLELVVFFHLYKN